MIVNLYKRDSCHLLAEVQYDRRKPCAYECIVDLSLSMEHYIPTIIRELTSWMNNIKPGSSVFIIGFGNNAAVIFKTTSLDEYSRKQALRNIKNMTTMGSTNIEKALTLANQESLNFEAHRDKYRILLTDGAPNIGEQDPQKLSCLCGGIKTTSFMFTPSSLLTLAQEIQKLDPVNNSIEYADMSNGELALNFGVVMENLGKDRSDVFLNIHGVQKKISMDTTSYYSFAFQEDMFDHWEVTAKLGYATLVNTIIFKLLGQSQKSEAELVQKCTIAECMEKLIHMNNTLVDQYETGSAPKIAANDEDWQVLTGAIAELDVSEEPVYRSLSAAHTRLSKFVEIPYQLRGISHMEVEDAHPPIGLTSQLASDDEGPMPRGLSANIDNDEPDAPRYTALSAASDPSSTAKFRSLSAASPSAPISFTTGVNAHHLAALRRM
jgi:hypothetical protein